MNATTRLYIEFGEPETPVPVPLRMVTARASRLPDETVMELPHPLHNLTAEGRTMRQSVNFTAERFIALIRQMLHKRRSS